MDSAHKLLGVYETTSQTVGWEDSPGGGQVPIRQSVAEPWWRWYCVCGRISRRHKSEQAAREAHAAHAENPYQH